MAGLKRHLRLNRQSTPATAAFLACFALLAFALGASPAGAVLARIGGRNYGVTPVRGVNPDRLPAVSRALRASPRAQSYDKTGQLVSHGGQVMHSVTTHVVYWDPNGEFTTTTRGIFSKFFADVGQESGSPSNVFAVAGQYTDSSGNAAYSSTSAAAKIDKDPYPSSENCTTPNGAFADPGPYSKCLYDEQLQSELATYIENEGLPTGPTQLYFLLLPHKVVSCFEEEDPEIGEEVCSNNIFCAYHSSFGSPSEEVIYSTIPFSLLDSESAKGCQSDGHSTVQIPNGDGTGTNETTRFADVALKYTSHEYIEAATDPLGDGWWETANGQEIGDKCNFLGSGSFPGEDPNAFLPSLGGSAAAGTLFNQAINGDHFYLQSEWDNAAKACRMQPLALSGVKFAPSQSSGLVGAVVKFSANATDPYGAASFTWKFGDGSEAVGSAPEHLYSAPGTYEVTMTATDQLTGATAPPVVQSFVVDAPAVVAPPSAAAAGPVAPVLSPPVVQPPATSAFTASSTVNAKTGAVTLSMSAGDPGRLTWLATFQNGKFGVFAASAGKCKKGLVRLGGRCRPAKIMFSKGHTSVAGAGKLTVVLKPSASGAKALRNALKKKKGVPVAITLTFQSSRGGSAVSHTTLVTIKLKTH